MSLSRLFSVLSVVVVCSSAACAATPAEEVLDPNAVLVDRASQALTADKVEWISGTYATTCKDPATGLAHAASDGWSLRVSGATAMTNPALTVTKGDSDCVLSLTAVGTTDGVYGATPTFALGAAYQGTASAFKIGAGPLAFYANAKLSATDMAANFTVFLSFSDDLATVSGGEKTGSYANWSGSSELSNVAAPNYTATNAVAISANNDDTVSSTTGSFTLTAGSQAGETYRVIDSEIVSPDFAKVDTAYNAVGGGAAAVAISGSPVVIASSDLLADGTQLPSKRTVIVRREQNGVAAYQIFTLAFAAPPSG